jgi:hypothetical protein
MRLRSGATGWRVSLPSYLWSAESACRSLTTASPSEELPYDSKAWRVDPPFGVLLLTKTACGGSDGRANRTPVPSYRFLPPPSDQTEEQARFECMRLVRAGANSDAELLRLRDQALSWRAVLDRMNERRADNALRALELLARHHTFT